LSGQHIGGEPIEVGRGLKVLPGLPVVIHEPTSTLVLADIHLGYEDAMASTGVFLPRLQLRMALETLDYSLRMLQYKPRLVIAGDLKHVFERLTRQERIEIAKFLRRATEATSEVVLVRGNHDTFVLPLLRTLGVELVEDCLHLSGGVYVAHGHKRPSCEFDLIVIGHEHPSLSVTVGGARAKLSIMLKVPLERGSEALVLAPTGVYQTGNAVTLDRRSYLSPIIREEGVVGDAIVWVVDRDYGTIKLAELKYVLEASL